MVSSGKAPIRVLRSVGEPGTGMVLAVKAIVDRREVCISSVRSEGGWGGVGRGSSGGGYTVCSGGYRDQWLVVQGLLRVRT